MLTEGYIRLNAAHIDGVAAIGAPAYISNANAGKIDFVAPAASGEVVRVVGYCIDSASSGDILFLFKPSTEWIEIA